MDANRKPPEQINWRLEGDRERADTLRGVGLQCKAQLQRENAYDYAVFARTWTERDGIRCTVQRNLGPLVDAYTITIFCPPRARGGEEEIRVQIPVLQPGQFFYVPGCVARYDAVLAPALPKSHAVHWINAVPGGALKDAVLNYRKDVVLRTRAACGLPAMEGRDQAGISRNIGVYSLPGGVASGMHLLKEHLPDNKDFSFSCAFRLNESLAYDYTFEERQVLNPIRSYYLKSSDGQQWAWDCPGSLCPVIGWAAPQYFKASQEHITYPWAPWDDDFSNEFLISGLKAADTVCPDAPLLAESWSASSPYWDRKDPPRPYPHPKGFVTGMRFVGLFVYNGKQLLCGRINDFQGQYQLSPVMTPPIALGEWMHAVVAQEQSGAFTFSLASSATEKGSRYSGVVSLEPMLPPTAVDAPYDYVFLGYNSWFVDLAQPHETISHFSMNAHLDICLPRFYGRAVNRAEAVLLHREALDGVFVADAFEMGQLVAAGLVPVSV